MNAYIDSSVVLRIVLREPGALREWKKLRLPLTSTLLRVECCRTLDRLLHDRAINQEQYATMLAEVDVLLARTRLGDIDRPVLDRASQRLPVRLSTLDAIHLATAERLRETTNEPFVFATHDTELAVAARTAGFRVIGGQ